MAQPRVVPGPASGEPLEARLIEDARRRRYHRGRLRQLFLLLGDAVAVAAPLAALHVVTGFPAGPSSPLLVVLGAAVISPAVMHVYGMYPRFPRYVTTSTLNELPRLFHATLVASLLSWVWFKFCGAHSLGVPLATMLVAGIFLTPLVRALTRHLLTTVLGSERILLVGSGSSTRSVAAALAARKDVVVVGQMPVPVHWRRGDDPGDPDARHLDHVVVEDHVDRVLLSTRDLGDTAVGDFLHWSRKADVSLTVLPEHFDVVGVGASIDQIQGATVVSLQPPLLSRTSRGLKRAMDTVGAAVGLVVLAPVMAGIAVSIRLDSPGPVFFRQRRIGRADRQFQLVKFRTMVPNADEMTEALMAGSTDPHWLQIENDPRITRVGRVLRSTSLDELPQLWNVLVGHMSLVGPRPLSVRDDARVNGWARGRLDLTPGLTGLWQVVGRKAVPFDEMVKLDYLYVNNWSLWGDIKLLLQTLPAVIQGRGAR